MFRRSIPMKISFCVLEAVVRAVDARESIGEVALPVGLPPYHRALGELAEHLVIDRRQLVIGVVVLRPERTVD